MGVYEKLSILVIFSVFMIYQNGTPIINKPIKLLSAHQPVYLPWLGLFHKIEVSDIFVIFDDVPFSKKMWYNRNRIKGNNGQVMLTVPVLLDGSRDTLHKDVRIDNTSNWKRKHWKSIELSYQKAPYFKKYAEELKSLLLANQWDFLRDLNEAMLKYFMRSLGIITPLIRASSYSFEGKKSDLVLDMCVQLGAEHYLFGALGIDYVDEHSFLNKKVVPLFQEYNHPTYYQGTKDFLAFMSVVDLLFWNGERSREILLSNNCSKEYFLKKRIT
jgi:hypothetical protein